MGCIARCRRRGLASRELIRRPTSASLGSAVVRGGGGGGEPRPPGPPPPPQTNPTPPHPPPPRPTSTHLNPPQPTPPHLNPPQPTSGTILACLWCLCGTGDGTSWASSSSSLSSSSSSSPSTPPTPSLLPGINPTGVGGGAVVVAGAAPHEQLAKLSQPIFDTLRHAGSLVADTSLPAQERLARIERALRLTVDTIAGWLGGWSVAGSQRCLWQRWQR